MNNTEDENSGFIDVQSYADSVEMAAQRANLSNKMLIGINLHVIDIKNKLSHIKTIGLVVSGLGTSLSCLAVILAIRAYNKN